MSKVTVSKNIGLKNGEKNGVDQFDNVFFNIDVKNGAQIELDEKELNYVRNTMKRFEKCQAILSKAMTQLEARGV